MWKSCEKGARLRRRQGMTNIWEQIKQYLETRISSEAYRNWIEKTEHEGQDGTRLRVRVPDDVTKQWVEQEFGDHIRSASRELNLPIGEVQYEIGSCHNFSRTEADGSQLVFAPPVTQLNPR